ncbi:src kinase-associated phosphoprotein 1 isoform X1 [Seriola lalandi dorsalis]|uniref:src kinase-associated phosphoprotein 1 n=1 Tax=Seriola aureovittata TaxID=2871759 RepID=UPI000C6F9F04|nr:src kinase-associated phosphoprotein 1 isoform X1 [Seriola lalandi dorsalis]XP_056222017.1 src kinase-associated phosphoprotein 1 [Seriola aureovittata]
MGTIPNDIRRLLDDCEVFISDILQNEDLSELAQESRKVLLNNFRVVHGRNPQEFPIPYSADEDGSDDNRSSSLGRSAPSDDASVASDYQDDGGPEYFGDIPFVAAQDLSNILKQGYLEKKRKDHSFFGSEWQKRWCVLNNSIFYYFGSEKDKQQKGSFYINYYSAQLVPNLRKDTKKNCCFELIAHGRRSFQFTASSPQEAREWVDQINFVLRDLSSSLIPFDDDEEEEEETYDDIEGVTGPPPPGPGAAQASQSRKRESEEVDEEDEDIYEVLPEEDFPDHMDESSEKNNKPAWSSDYANYYQGLWDCEADEPDELCFHRGDLIYIISKEYNIHGWWVGELNGTVGIVPKDFLHPAYIL